MRKLLLIVVIAIYAIGLKAQEPVFLKDDKVVNIGIGLNSYPVISLSGEKGIIDGISDAGVIGVGGYLALGASSYHHNSTFSFGARGTFHYPIVDKLDTYVGVGIGFSYRTWRYEDDDFFYIPGFFIGASYPINDDLKIFGEAGYNASYLTFGISFKI